MTTTWERVGKHGNYFNINLCGNKGTKPVLVEGSFKREDAENLAKELARAIGLPTRITSTPSPKRTKRRSSAKTTKRADAARSQRRRLRALPLRFRPAMDSSTAHTAAVSCAAWPVDIAAA